MDLLVAALSWDPQIRGILIVLTSVVILCGSVYLLLATNTGAKVGFLLAAAGLTGWMTVMGVVWTVYGIGLRGKAPHWKVLEVATGDLRRESTLEAIEGFPRGWERMRTGNPILGDAQASADTVLIPAAETDAGHGGGGEPSETGEEFAPLFDDPAEYVPVAGFRKGGEDYYLPGGYLERSSGFLPGWFHKPHYAVIQVQPALEQPETGGAPAPPTADPSQPITSVVMIRDLGAVRKNSVVLTIAMGILFGLICNALHRRDKEIHAARVAAKTG
jgi:hypothetical protein